MLPGAAVADDFTIAEGETVTTTRTLADPGDSGVIRAGGMIVTTAGNEIAAEMLNDGQSFYNAGVISTAGGSAWGIHSAGANSTIVNSGEIATAGSSGFGIFSTGASATITNSGAIATALDAAFGIFVVSSGSTIDNSGSIATTGLNGFGIQVAGNGNTIVNSGTITTANAGAIAIIVSGDDNILTSSGALVSEQDAAISMGGADNTLNLLAGSAIQGAVKFGDPGSATLNIGPGLNTALTLTGVPATIDTAGQPYVLSGDLLAVVDPVGIGGAQALLAGATGGISGSLDQRMRGSSAGSAPFLVTSYFPVAETGGDASPATGWWGDVFGGMSARDGTAGEAGYSQFHGGIVVGFDREVSAATTAGLFGGGSAGRFATDASASVVSMGGVFGGAYIRHDAGGFFAGLSVSGGVTFNDSDRHVANNLVAGGIETASASYAGLHASPSLTVGTDITVAGATVTPSLRTRYTGIYLDGYSESGSAANVTVGSRVLHVLELRGQVEAALAARRTDNGTQQVSLRTGADGVFNRGDDIEASLLGSDLSFASGATENAARGFVGMDTSYTAVSGRKYNAGFELGYGSDRVLTVDVRARVIGRF
ncbi:MAG: hypothetical protein Kow0026_27300 [Oricola sp.]